MSNELQLPTSRKSTGSATDFITYKVYDSPSTEGGKPIWFANISFDKGNKETAELYLQQLVDHKIHHSFLNENERIERQMTTKEQVLSRFAKLKA